MKPKNFLFLMSDEHTRRISGCYGDGIVKTPNIDSLAASGSRFTHAYTNSPICVPARASLATGQWVHQNGSWSCAEPYDGSIPSWAHRVRDNGSDCTSIGKLHFRRTEDDNGFTQEILPQHCIRGLGWVKGLIRDEPLPDYNEGTKGFAEQIGPGESAYTRHDADVCEAACDWLRKKAAEPGGSPWVLYVSFISPHYPLIAPEAFFDMYRDVDIPAPHNQDESPDNEKLQELYRFFNYRDHLDQEAVLRACRAYYALCSYLDHLIGRVLDTLDEVGLRQDTRIAYTSDHGEMLGAHGMWTKQVMYEDAVGVPLILSGPDIPVRKVVTTPVSLVDFFPTVTEAVGVPPCREDEGLPGRNLIDLANAPHVDRPILSEFHDGGSTNGIFMLRHKQWKLVYYVDGVPQLFDMVEDPNEDRDLAADPAFKDALQECIAELRKILDPEEVDARAHSDQAKRIESLGGRDAVLNMEGMHFFVQGV